jgi:hypothetical protein
MEFKPSIIKLARERLGPPFASVIDNDRPLRINDFYDDKGSINEAIINKVCESVLYFQTRTMIDSLDEDDKEFINEGNSLKPKFLIAPYFYLSPQLYSEWLEISLACYKRTKELSKSSPIFLNVVISKEALEENEKDISRRISQIRPDGIILWIDNQIEEEMSKSEILRYIKFIQNLRGSTQEIFNSHGGYLSKILSHRDLNSLLNGVGHCMNYGESRSVIPIGGGIPMARFYFPSIHSRMRYGDALGVSLSKGWLKSEEIYLEKVCRCAQCVKLLKEKGSAEKAFASYGESNPVTFIRKSGSIVRLEFPTSEAKQIAAIHYLYNKAHELNSIMSQSIKEILAQLENTNKEISETPNETSITHLKKWYDSIHELYTSTVIRDH